MKLSNTQVSTIAILAAEYQHNEDNLPDVVTCFRNVAWCFGGELERVWVMYLLIGRYGYRIGSIELEAAVNEVWQYMLDIAQYHGISTERRRP